MRTKQSKHRKPFKIAQLVQHRNNQFADPHLQGIFLVLDFEWDLQYNYWKVRVLQQQTGEKQRFDADYLRPIEKKP
jgi:hypothetical protein